MNGRTQTGLVGCASIDDYCNNVILKHENTLEAKEQDRIRPHRRMRRLTGSDLSRLPRRQKPGIRDHLKRKCQRFHICTLQTDITAAASAVKVGLKRRAEDLHFSGTEEYNYFLSVLFPADELAIYDYNRVVTDMNGYTFEQFLDTIKSRFDVALAGVEAVRPQKKGEFGMYADGNWYRVNAKADLFSGDPVKDLDVSVLQDHILSGSGHQRSQNRFPHPFYRRNPGT